MSRVWFFHSMATIISEHSTFQSLTWLADRALSPLNIAQLGQAKRPFVVSITRVPPLPTIIRSGPIALFTGQILSRHLHSIYAYCCSYLSSWPNNKSRFGHFCIACASVYGYMPLVICRRLLPQRQPSFSVKGSVEAVWYVELRDHSGICLPQWRILRSVLHAFRAKLGVSSHITDGGLLLGFTRDEATTLPDNE